MDISRIGSGTIPNCVYYSKDNIKEQVKKDTCEISYNSTFCLEHGRSRNLNNLVRAKRSDTHLITLSKHYAEFNHLLNFCPPSLHLGVIRNFFHSNSIKSLRESIRHNGY